MESRKHSSIHAQCECVDKGCKAHFNQTCSIITRLRTLFRVDMEDRTGTRFCFDCAEDAMESGLFADRRA